MSDAQNVVGSALYRRPLALVLVCVTALLLSNPSHAFKFDNSCGENAIVFGVNVFGAANFQIVKNARIGWVRITIPWRDVNPAQNTWTFSQIDSEINSARAKGLKILAVLSTAPQWAGSNASGAKPPSNTNHWKTFVKKVAQRYKNKVEAWEVWNEPNLQNNPGPGIGWDQPISSSPRYSDYLRYAAQKIRQYAPGTLVVAPGTSSSPNSRTVQIFKQIQNTNSSQYVDVVSFHANGTNKSVSTVNSRISSHLSTLTVRNPANKEKPIWITEFGWDSGAVGESAQKSRTNGIVDEQKGNIAFPGCGGRFNYDITHGFVYTLIDQFGTTEGIHKSSGAKKKVTKDYIDNFPFPARDPGFFTVEVTASCSGRTCTFTSSWTDPLNLADFNWKFGDGTPTVTTDGHQVSHTFSKSGNHFVKMVTSNLPASDMILVDVP